MLCFIFATVFVENCFLFYLFVFFIGHLTVVRCSLFVWCSFAVIPFVCGVRCSFFLQVFNEFWKQKRRWWSQKFYNRVSFGCFSHQVKSNLRVFQTVRPVLPKDNPTFWRKHRNIKVKSPSAKPELVWRLIGGNQGRGEISPPSPPPHIPNFFNFVRKQATLNYEVLRTNKELLSIFLWSILGKL